MTQMESPKRKMQKKNDYQRHKLFRKIKRRRKAQAEADQQIAMKHLRNKLKLPKFGDGKNIKSDAGAPLEVKDGMLYYKKQMSNKARNMFKLAAIGGVGITAANKVNSNKNYNSGKDIRIKPSKRGTFTKAAKQHGMSVQGFANKVLRNPSNYSAAMRKKANFAHNAAGWKH